MDLVFEINEGPTTGVSRIIFIGNKAFSDGTLRDKTWLAPLVAPLRPALREVMAVSLFVNILALGLPLRSVELELGPSQCEFTFAPAKGLEPADNMVLFRSATKQIARRAGYHASFVCRPPFAHVMSSGWHLHHSLVAPDGEPAPRGTRSVRESASALRRSSAGARRSAGSLERGSSVDGRSSCKAKSPRRPTTCSD